LASETNRAVQAYGARQIEAIYPGLYVGQDVGLRGAINGKVSNGPIHGANLNVLPLGQLAPQATHADFPLKHQGV
jgi:hypothetical protein